MREFKFRAWSKDDNLMVYADEDNSAAYWDGVCASDVEIVNGRLGNRFSSYTWMQYTGCKDKNKEEIYEGDIVKCNGFISEIKWNKSTGYKVVDRLTCRTMKTKGYSALGSRAHVCEVIGNIHENPELLDSL